MYQVRLKNKDGMIRECTVNGESLWKAITEAERLQGKGGFYAYNWSKID